MEISPDDHPIPTAKRERLNPTEHQHHCLKNMLLIYADDHLQEDNDDFQKILGELHHRINDVKLFNNARICVQFFNQLKTEQVIVIISGAIREDLLPKIDRLPQVYAIYLIDEQLISDGEWLKVKSVHTNIVSIYKSVENDIKQYQESVEKNMKQYQENVSITFASPKKDQLDPSFMYTQLFKTTLLQKEYDQRSLVKFVSFSQRKHADNKVTLDIIKKFRETYRSDEAILWYTQYPFIYEVVNRACRLLEGDIIIDMGFFIRDLCNQIKQLHEEQMRQCDSESFYLYRGEGISTEDFEKLKSKKGQLMCFNGFLSTSGDEAVGRCFADSNSTEQGKVRILFKIMINPKIRSIPYAELKENSQFKTEGEYLFSMHSVFRTGNIKYPTDDNGIYEVDLTLTSDDDVELRHLTSNMELEISCLPEDEKLRTLLMRIGQDRSAEERYLASLDQAIPVSEKVRCYLELGVIKRDRGRYQEALDCFQKAVSIQKDIFLEDDPAFESLYQSMGAIHTLMGKYPDALTYYKRSLDIRKKHCLLNDPLLVTCYGNIGITYCEMGKYSDALSYFKETLPILTDKFVFNHPYFSKIYLNITAVNMKMENYLEALEYGEKALELFKTTLCKYHPLLAEAHNNVGATYSAMEKLEEAFSHYQQVLDIRQERGDLDPRVLGATYNNIGKVCLKRYDYPEALSNFNQAVKTFQLILSEQDNHWVAMVYTNIAEMYLEIEEYADASFFCEKALCIYQNLIDNCLDLVTPYDKMGTMYLAMKDYQKAVHCFKQVLDSMKKAQPNNHQLLATMFIRLGYAYQGMKEYVLKTLHFRIALNITRRHHLPVDPALDSLSDDDMSCAVRFIELIVMALSLKELIPTVISS